MPILPPETSLFPTNLLSQAELELTDCPADSDESVRWWAMYTRSRQEKQLMRKLLALEAAYCCPTIERRYRSPNGRVRRVFEPLFSNYVFVYGDPSVRYAALTTNCVSQCRAVRDGLRLTQDLAQIQRLIAIGEPLSPESRLLPGDQVRVKTGSFAGFEGTIVQRKHETRLLVAVNFMQQGASVLLQDCQLEYLGPPTTLANTHEKVKGSVDVVYKLQSGRYEVPLTKRSG
jgi:transcription antitermination factor NusG